MISKAIKLYKVLLLSLVLVLFTFGTPVRAANFGAAAYDFLGNILGDDESGRGLLGTLATGLMDYLYTVVFGCPSDGMKELGEAADPQTHLCNPRIAGILQETGGNGSLLAVAGSSLGGMMDTPPPVNMAMYWNNVKQESLIGGTAYAAGPGTVYSSILEFWKLTRNIAYGLLAAAVIIIAIMVTLRKKIDAQTVVTAQAAIPRIVISAVLIGLSYPIGALFLESIFPLMRVAIFIAWNASTDILATAGTSCPFVAAGGAPGVRVSGLISCSIISMWKGAAGGAATVLNPGSLLLLLIQGVVLVIALILLAYKYLDAIIRISIVTIFAPIFIAVAAIPGNEKNIRDWLGEMAGAVLGIPVMILLTILALLITITMNLSYIDAVTNAYLNDLTNRGAVEFGAHLLFPVGVWGGQIIGTYILFYAITAPGKISKAIKGPPPKK